MDSKRQLKYSRLIQRDLAEIFQKESRALFGQAFITVTRVDISPDLSVAKIYLSMMLTDDKQALLKEIRIQTKHLRQTLGVKIRHQARIVPELIFYLDETVDYAMKMNDLFNDLHIPPSTNVNEDDYDKK